MYQQVKIMQFRTLNTSLYTMQGIGNPVTTITAFETTQGRCSWFVCIRQQPSLIASGVISEFEQQRVLRGKAVRSFPRRSHYTDSIDIC